MYGKKYQWVIVGTYSHDWWKKYDTDFNCTLEELESALEQALITDLLPLSTSIEITIAGITANEYKLEYDSRRGGEYSRFHGYTYDGIWAVALAIQSVARRIKYYRRNESVADFRYRDPLWERLFLDALHNTSFEGVTGPVRFYDNERKASILLKQFQDGKEIKVGEYNAATQHLDLTLGAPLKWIGKHPPKDQTLVIIEHTRVNKTVYAILATLAVLGIIMASVFLAFNIKYRNQRYIKMSSPQLNNLIIIGCMLTYTSIIFLGLDSGLSSIEAFPYICTARAWTLMAGFSLAFGAMFSKTWRVHSIFTDVKLNKKVIKDYQLFMVVGVLLFIDLVIMTTWQVADPFYRDTKQMERYPHPSNEDIIIIPENEYCASEHQTIFVGSIYVYKGLLMIFGAFLAWETRHVSIPALNDSRHVGLSVYNVAIMCICGAAVALVLVDHQDAMFLIIGVFVLFCTTATLWLVFVPKMLELRRNPGGSIDKRFRPTLRPMSKTRRDSSVSELETKLKDVKSLNSKYRKTLLEKESELQMLIRRLGNEAKELLESRESMSDTNRLSVPLIRKEQPSATETSDITSLCSLSSQDYASLQHTDSQNVMGNHTHHKAKRKKQQETESQKLEKSPNPPKQEHEPDQKQLNGSVKLTPTLGVDKNYNSVKDTLNAEYEKPPEQIDSKKEEVKKVKTPTHERRPSRTLESDLTSKRKQSLKPEFLPEIEETTTHKPGNRTPAKKKAEYGTHVVAKSELWDTGNQHRCTKSHQKPGRVSISQDEDDSYMHRTVSERNRHSSQKEKREKSPVSRNKQQEMPKNICQQQCNKLGYFQSTPNVAAAHRQPNSTPKRDKSMYNATSESELLDREILPIFQKLLTERNKSQHNIDYSFGRSCPNISIKCDIVEYL
ncbi:unnamed protein product [Acanthoscelides obtectus]|uniref:G-protein coupled receptors family 3 profile domain-containing protein n=1 Tax=Acanthoscelides obtectus TaxID=200917 RepID=A0A9P0Q512_ACAOB|nr:unnamed protein product [Acanthoscelides obtectus]CAK1658382.1 Gamma-aminobutyric acid type B receptor subunit 2 [Acanthoscelides obtectus]